MFNLYENTHHEAGIILYGDKTIGVFNWGQFDDGFVPMVGPVGIVVPWPAGTAENDVELVYVTHADDVRDYLPGTVWMGEDGLETDMDVAYDQNDDVPALWGFGPAANAYSDMDNPYSGTIWDIPGGPRVITIDLWQ